MKTLLLGLIFVSTFAQAAGEIFEALGEAKLKRTTGKVYLSGKYHANGRFKCDDNFLSGGRIYFTLGSDDYSYTLLDVLGHPDLLRKSKTSLRDLASEGKASDWQIETASYIKGKRFTLLPKDRNSPIKKIYLVTDEDRIMQSIYLDFGTHNLSFFAF